MSILDAQKTLADLESHIAREELVVQGLIKSGKHDKASDELAKIIAHGYRELNLSAAEILGPTPNFASANEPSSADLKDKVSLQYNNMSNKLRLLGEQKASCDSTYIKTREKIEADELAARNKEIAEKGVKEQEYVEAYKKLDGLVKNQKEPKPGVEQNLNIFLGQVRKFKNQISTEELSEIMDVTYQYVTGHSHDKFNSMLKSLNNKDSIPLKILGATLIALGVALVFAAIIFAPALITAPGIGLATIYAASAATAVSSAALLVSGTAFFNKETSRMKLAETLRPLDEKHLEEADAHYAPVNAM